MKKRFENEKPVGAAGNQTEFWCENALKQKTEWVRGFFALETLQKRKNGLDPWFFARRKTKNALKKQKPI
ncbi:MAG: hypothetical protein WC607_00470 [Candidatus Micrarchaeia archaeon]